MTGYHLLITILDKSSPNASRQILRGSASTRSAGRTPHPTSTGLPGQLDFRIASTPSYSPSQPAGFWSDLSQAPTTRLGERWDNLQELSPISPTALWYEPDSILAPSASAPPSFTPAPTLDYRFGPISLDWIDHPASHPAFSPITHTSNDPRSSSPDKPPRMTKSKKNRTSSAAQTLTQPSTSSLPLPDPKSPPVKLDLPTARFVAESSGKANYQLGSTDFGYGTIQLYRDLEETEDPKSQASHQKQPQNSTEPCPNRPPEEMKKFNDRDGTVVAVLAIPSYMTSQDFLAFISPVVESIESVRMLRDSLPNRCIGLIKFRGCQAARLFAKEFNGRSFSHLQDREICHTAFIRSVQFKSSLIPPFTFPALLPPDLLTQSAHELPTCPVCLERMDVSVTGLMTKTCSHTFHCHCLSNWGDSRCPICRYSESKLSRSSDPDQSECAACGSQANLWICLICGHVGCGRYQGGHAYRHFEESAHLYALELGSQRVWDYVGDKSVTSSNRVESVDYVHRLIQTKSDQIVELPALSSAVFDSGGGPGRTEAAHQSKIEAISEEFGHLVASQLDSQRAFYEEEIRILRGRLESTRQETEEQKALVKKLQNQLKAIEESSQSVEKSAKKEKSTQAKKTERSLQLSQRLESELNEERAMSAGMRMQIKKLEEERNTERKKTSDLSEQIIDIKEQLRDMMFFIDMQSKIQGNTGGASELQGGSIVVQNPSPSGKPPSTGKKE